MTIPTIFIVGAPRCGTTSLHAYLSSHPRIFMCEPKEPHHFGSDLPLPPDRPYVDFQQYLRLFDAAGDRHAGEASVHYLYSKTAPREILAVSPEARILIMLRNPVDMVSSMHAHCLLGGYEDLPDLEQALDAEADRRQGRRIPPQCPSPLSLQYAFLGKYTEHVRRYLQEFGGDRVKCVLFDDLKNEPAKVYKETLAFLRLEPASLPDFRVHNARLRWRTLRIAGFVRRTLESTHRLTLRGGFLGKAARRLFDPLFYLTMRLSLTKDQSITRPEVRARLRELFRDDIEQLATLLQLDLSSWLQN